MTKELENQLTETATVAGVILKEPENFPKELRLELTQSNLFTDSEESFDVALTSYDDDEKTYNRSKLEKAFNRIAEDTETEIEVPDNITKESVTKALKNAKGKSIEVYIGERDLKNEDGELIGTDTYKSLFPQIQFSNKFIKSTHKIEDLVKMLELTDLNKKIRVRPIAFQYQDMTSAYAGGEFKKADVVEATKTRLGFARHIASVLQKDESENAKKAQERLTAYVKKHMKDAKSDNPNDFTGRSGDIIQEVGLFSDRAYQAKGVDEYVTTVLSNMLDNQKLKGRANLGTVRMFFTVDSLGDDVIFKTRPLREGIFKKNGNSSEILKATFNPDDTNFYEFRKFIEPLFRLGALSHEDVKDMKDDTNHFSILNRLTDTLIDNSIMAQVHVLSSGENYSADVLTLEHPSENEVSKGTKDYRS